MESWEILAVKYVNFCQKTRGSDEKSSVCYEGGVNYFVKITSIRSSLSGLKMA